MRTPEGAVNWLHADHLGSTSLATSAGPNPTVVSRQLYYPFGQVRWESESPLPTDFGYTGQRLDATGLMFYHARYYAPQIGRFVQADTIVPEPGNPQSLNRYAYVNNRPLLFADPSGHCGELTIDGPLCKERERDISSWPGWAQEAAVASCSLTGGCRVREKADGRTVIRSGGPELCMEALESQVMGLANPIAAPAVGLVDDLGGGLVGRAGRAIKNVVGKVASKLGIGKAAGSELAHSLSNLGDDVLARNTTSLLDDFAPGAGFSGVYDPTTGMFLIQPSGNTVLKTGAIPENLVAQRGGHAIVNARFAELAGVDASQTVGFTVFYDAAGELSVAWNSGSVNGLNYGSYAAPTRFRQLILDAIKEATGFHVSSR